MENNKSEPVFIGGMFLSTVAETAPAWVITKQSIHMETLYNWLKANKHLANEKGYINIQGLEGKSGKRYFSLDTYEKKEVVEAPQASNTQPVEGKGIDITEFTGAVKNTEDIPF